MNANMACGNVPLFPFFVVLIVVFGWGSVSSSDSSSDSFIYGGCTQLRYLPDSAYGLNLNSLLTSLVNSATYSSFNKFTVVGPSSNDAVYGLYQCRGDLSMPECATCVARTVTESGITCSGTCGGTIQLQGCYLRYDNATFLGEEDKTVAFKKCGPSDGYQADVMGRRDSVLAGLVGATGPYRVGGSGELLGVAQCTGDLSTGQCQDCVYEAIRRLKSECATATTGDMFLVKCYARYSVYGNQMFTKSDNGYEDICNTLSGPLPSGLWNLSSSLRNLYLQGNRFDGPIPESIFSMTGLARLNLAGNQLTGGISPRFNELVGLKALLMERNSLTGSLPELNLKLDQFNVSQNGLIGSIPQSLSEFPSSAFQGNSLCGMPLAPCNQPGTQSQIAPSTPTATPSETEIETHTESVHNTVPKRKSSNNMSIAIGTGIGFCSVIAIVAALSTMRMRCKIELQKDVQAYSSKQGDPAGNDALVFLRKGGEVFELEELLMASAEVLGNGTQGTCYKAMLRDGAVVSVKRLKDVNVKESEFDERMIDIARMEHPNLVPLLAYYHSKDVKLLVHEYVRNGSLSALLHGEDSAGKARLNWQTRCNIALGAARGMEHIHSIGPMASHGNVKSSNILLTESYEARASDFGLAGLVGPDTSLLLGLTRGGYRAPEVIDPRVASQEADVYGFGVVLLELLTGKDPRGLLSSDGGDRTADVELPTWIRLSSGIRTADVFDEGLIGCDDADDVNRRGMTEMLKIAADCTDLSPSNRPTMSEVVRRIERTVLKWAKPIG